MEASSPWINPDRFGPSGWSQPAGYLPKQRAALTQTQMVTDAIKGLFGGGSGSSALGPGSGTGQTAGAYPMLSLEGMDPHQKALAQAKYLHNMRQQWSNAQQPAGNQGAAAPGATANVNTGIAANPVYTPETVQKQINQIRAGYEVDPAFAQKGLVAPGVGTSAGTLSAAMPGLIQGQMGAESDVQNLLLGSRQANLGNVLQGQTLQSQMGLGAAGNQIQRLLDEMGYGRGMQGIDMGYRELDQRKRNAGIEALLGALFS